MLSGFSSRRDSIRGHHRQTYTQLGFIQPSQGGWIRWGWNRLGQYGRCQGQKKNIFLKRAHSGSCSPSQKLWHSLFIQKTLFSTDVIPNQIFTWWLLIAHRCLLTHGSWAAVSIIDGGCNHSLSRDFNSQSHFDSFEPNNKYDGGAGNASHVTLTTLNDSTGCKSWWLSSMICCWRRLSCEKCNVFKNQFSCYSMAPLG